MKPDARAAAHLRRRRIPSARRAARAHLEDDRRLSRPTRQPRGRRAPRSAARAQAADDGPSRLDGRANVAVADPDAREALGLSGTARADHGWLHVAIVHAHRHTRQMFRMADPDAPRRSSPAPLRSHQRRPALTLQILLCLFGVPDGLRPQIEPSAGVEAAIAEQLRLPAVLAVTTKLAGDLTAVLPQRPERLTRPRHPRGWAVWRSASRRVRPPCSPNRPARWEELGRMFPIRLHLWLRGATPSFERSVTAPPNCGGFR